MYKPGSVKGLSTLRPKEEKPAELSEAAKARQKYLDQMYGGGSAAADPGAKPKRKRKRPGSASLPGGVKVGLHRAVHVASSQWRLTSLPVPLTQTSRGGAPPAVQTRSEW